LAFHHRPSPRRLRDGGPSRGVLELPTSAGRHGAEVRRHRTKRESDPGRGGRGSAINAAHGHFVAGPMAGWIAADYTSRRRTRWRRMSSMRAALPNGRCPDAARSVLDPPKGQANALMRSPPEGPQAREPRKKAVQAGRLEMPSCPLFPKTSPVPAERGSASDRMPASGHVGGTPEP